MALTHKDIDAVVAEDGCLLADSYQCFACENCDSYHFVLYDRKDQRFAVMMVPPEALIPLADLMIGQALKLAGEGKLDIPRAH